MPSAYSATGEHRRLKVNAGAGSPQGSKFMIKLRAVLLAC
jgi:hypothetical protein